MKEMEEKFQAEEAGGDHPWYEVFTGPRMLYRVLLGMTILALQQLTGANYFCKSLCFLKLCSGTSLRGVSLSGDEFQPLHLTVIHSLLRN